jgi:hypothetical protein
MIVGISQRVEHTYDRLGRAVAEAWHEAPVGGDPAVLAVTVRHEYDGLGRRTQVSETDELLGVG